MKKKAFSNEDIKRQIYFNTSFISEKGAKCRILSQTNDNAEVLNEDTGQIVNVKYKLIHHLLPEWDVNKQCNK